MKAEATAVEVDRLFDVCDEVAHSRLCHVRLLRFACWRISLLGARRSSLRIVLQSAYSRLWEAIDPERVRRCASGHHACRAGGQTSSCGWSRFSWPARPRAVAVCCHWREPQPSSLIGPVDSTP